MKSDLYVFMQYCHIAKYLLSIIEILPLKPIEEQYLEVQVMRLEKPWHL